MMRQLAPKTIFAALFLLAAFLLVPAARAADTVDVYYRFADYTDTPLNVRRVTITAIGPSVEYASTTYLSQKPIYYSAATWPTLTNGYLTATNLLTGYAYRVAFSDGYGEPTITNYFGTNLSGTVGAVTNTVTWIDWAITRDPKFFGPYFGTTNTIISISTNGGAAVTGTNLAVATTNDSVVTINVSTGAVVTIAQQQMAAGSNAVTAASISAATGNISALSAVTVTASGGISGSMSGDNINSGTVADARLASTIARDSEVLTATNNTAQTWDAEVPLIIDTNSVKVFNVEKYGAAPDTDSTAAIQAAMNAASAVGGTVYFPRGNYITTAPLTFTAKIRMEGHLMNGFTITNSAGTDIIQGLQGVYNFSVNNMVLASAAGASATNAGLRLVADAATGFGLCYLGHVDIYGGRHGLWASNMFTSEIRDVRFLTNTIGAEFVGQAVGRILIDGGGGGSGTSLCYLIDQGSYFVFDGVDMGGITNTIKIIKPAFVTVQNCNLEGAAASSDDTIDTAYIKYHSADTGGLLRLLNNRFGAGNGATLTASYSVSISNALLSIADGNTFSNDGPSGAPIEEYGTIPCPTYISSPENYGSQLWVTNRTVLKGRKPRQYVQDLQNSGRSSFLTSASYWGAVWYDSRTNSDASDALYHHAKFADGSYRGVNLFGPYTDTYIIGRFGVGSNAYSGWNTSGGALSGLDIAVNYAITIGSDQNTATRTTATAKRGRIGGAPYTTSRLPVSLLESYNDASHNTAFWGGGWTGYDAVTRHRFYAASAINTTVGTLNFEITHTGVYANTNFHAVAVTATNFIAMPTNYVGANFAPVSGMVKLVTSNDWIYSVTTLTTNRAFQINP